MLSHRVMLAFVVIHVVAAFSWAQTGTVKVTPLGSRTGDFAFWTELFCSKIRPVCGFSTIPETQYRVGRTLGLARFMPCSSVTRTGIISGI